MTRVLVGSHAMTMELKQRHDHESPGFQLASRSQAFSLEEAESFDSRPHPRRRRRPRIQKESLLDWPLFWGLFSLPGLLLIIEGSWGLIYTVIAGLILTALGKYWGAVCPTRNYILRWGPGLVGLMLVINGVLSALVPVKLLLIAALILTPFAVGRFYGKA